MSTVGISAARFRSLLANRNISIDDAGAAIATRVNLHELAEADQEVEFEDIEKLAKLIGRPWSYVLIDEPEPPPDYGQDNRTVANRRRPLSPDMRWQLEAASGLLDDALELFPGDSFEVPADAGSASSSEEMAVKVRAFLRVSHDDQLEARDEFASLRLWVGALHRRNVYVLQRHLEDPSVRAFSMIRQSHALAVIDTRDSAYAREFSALHEYAHLVLRSAGVCDLDDHSTVERYCNEVAAGVLLPVPLLDMVVRRQQFSGNAAHDDETLIRLSRQLRVSQAVLLIRLRDLARISQDQFEPLETRRSQRRRSSSRGGTYYTPAINRVGRKFARNVVGAWDEGDLNRQEASALLGVGEHNAERFRVELLKGDDGAQ